MIISKVIPQKIKNYIKRNKCMKDFDVILHENADGSNTIFEGKNILRTNTELQSSYCGFGTTISENTKLKKVDFGKYCSIGQNVVNAVGMHPSKIFVSTHPSFYAPSEERISFSKEVMFNTHNYLDDTKKYLTKIGHDVWIGNNVTIFDGIEIGDGAIIGTGAVVTKNIEPYAIVGGIPAKLIRYRFNEVQIEFLLKFQWWHKSEEWIRKNWELFLDINILMEKGNKL